MTRDAVERGLVRLVGAAEAEMVGHDRSVARLDERRDEVAIEGAPGRVPLHQDHWTDLARALVDVVHPAAFPVEPLRFVWPGALERPLDRAHRLLTLPGDAGRMAPPGRPGASAARSSMASPCSIRSRTSQQRNAGSSPH